MNLKIAALCLAAIILPVDSFAAKQNLIEYLSAQINNDKGFTQKESAELIEKIKTRYAAYSFDVLDDKKLAAAKAALGIITEGSFDGTSAQRIAEVSFAAYQAAARGAPADIVEEIALYGYRKRISAEMISLWANGYNQLIENKIDPPIAADLVRNAMENDWDERVFNEVKWALVESKQKRFDAAKYSSYLFANLLKNKSKPGQLIADANTHFISHRDKGTPIIIPPYKGIFEIPKTDKPQNQTTESAPVAAQTKTVKQNKKNSEQKIVTEPDKTYSGFEVVWTGLKKTAISYLGTPYVWGGMTHAGIDCSGFTHNTFVENRINIPRVSRDQWTTGKQIPFAQVKNGDLIFFDTRGTGGISHVGMVISSEGKTSFIHASCSRGVTIDSMDKQYFMMRYKGVRRVTE